MAFSFTSYLKTLKDLVGTASTGTTGYLVRVTSTGFGLVAPSTVTQYTDALAVSAVKAKTFVSTELTGNGSAQSTAHGLGVTPTKILIAVTDSGVTGVYAVTEGTHTSTNVVVTVTSGAKYKIHAL